MKVLQRRKQYFWVLLFSAFCLSSAWNGSSFAQEIDPAEVVPEAEEPSIRSLQRKAEQLRQEEKWEEAVAVYRQLVERDPKSGVDWHLLGFSLHGTGEIDKAIAAHKIAAKFDQYKPHSLYNLGCAYSLKDDADKSFDHLRKAIDAGFPDVDMLQTDSDLENIRKDETRFKELLAYANGDTVDKKEKADDDSKSEKNPLVGSWEMLSGKKGGADVEAGRMPPSIKISNDAFTLPSPEGGEPFVMSYVVDKSTTPHNIDFNIESGPVPQGEALGIFKLEDDKMTLIYDPTAQNRPEKFESTEDNGCLMFVMKKMAKGADPDVNKKLVGTWSFKSGKRAGSEVDKDRLQINVEINDKTFTIPAGPDETFVIRYEIDASASPMKIDMKVDSGPAPEGSTAVGIIKIGDGEFAICYHAEGGARPEEFESTEENGCFMFKMKKLEVD
jgi:uncharacterized protein (TIGR03067 family)